MTWILFLNWLFWNFWMVASKSFIDFWLKGEAPGGSSYLHFLNSWFDNDF
jgi:hypothetical protein